MRANGAGIARMAAMIQVVRSSCEKTVVKEGPLALGNKDKRVEVPAAPNREVHQTTVADFTSTATATNKACHKTT